MVQYTPWKCVCTHQLMLPDLTGTWDIVFSNQEVQLSAAMVYGRQCHGAEGVAL